MNRVPARNLLPAILLLLLPETAASILLPALLHRPPSQAGLLAWRAALALPMVAFPLLLALARVQPWQTRAAIGLGAGWFHRLRWIWLPQLGPGIALSLLLAALFTLGAWLVH